MQAELTNPKPVRFRKKDWAEAQEILKKSKTATSGAQIIRAAVELGMSKARERFIK
jgi:hypothetical protein